MKLSLAWHEPREPYAPVTLRLHELQKMQHLALGFPNVVQRWGLSSKSHLQSGVPQGRTKMTSLSIVWLCWYMGIKRTYPSIHYFTTTKTTVVGGKYHHAIVNLWFPFALATSMLAWGISLQPLTQLYGLSIKDVHHLPLQRNVASGLGNLSFWYTSLKCKMDWIVAPPYPAEPNSK